MNRCSIRDIRAVVTGQMIGVIDGGTQMALAVQRTDPDEDAQEASPDELLEAAIVRAEAAFRRLERKVTAPPEDRPPLLH